MQIALITVFWGSRHISGVQVWPGTEAGKHKHTPVHLFYFLKVFEYTDHSDKSEQNIVISWILTWTGEYFFQF